MTSQFDTFLFSRHILSRDTLQLLGRQTAHERWRKELDSRVRTSSQMAVCRLHADVVHEPLSGHLVVRLQDVMQMLDSAFNIADVHVSGKSRHLHKFAIIIVMERSALNQCLRTFLVTAVWLDDLGPAWGPLHSPFLKVLSKVVVVGHWVVFNLKDGACLVHGALVSLDELVHHHRQKS